MSHPLFPLCSRKLGKDLEDWPGGKFLDTVGTTNMGKDCYTDSKQESFLLKRFCEQQSPACYKLPVFIAMCYNTPLFSTSSLSTGEVSTSRSFHLMLRPGSAEAAWALVFLFLLKYFFLCWDCTVGLTPPLSHTPSPASAICNAPGDSNMHQD